MPTQWFWSQSWSVHSATASGPPSVPRPSKKVVKKTPGTRPSRKLWQLRPRPPWTFLCGSGRWLLAAPEATIPLWNLPRITPTTKALFCSASRRYEQCFPIILSELRPWRDPRRDYQKGRHNRNCCNCGPRGSRPQGSTLATRVNTTETPARNNCGRDQPARQEDKDMTRTICYKCNKKGHFVN